MTEGQFGGKYFGFAQEVSNLVFTTEFIARVEHFILRTSRPNAQAVRFITQRKGLQK